MTTWVDVTPTMATEWLEKYNTKNRPVKDSVVKRYAKDMREGRWLNRSAEPIIFDWEESLVDGQHRLWAVIESGVSITFLVVENADPKQRQVTDIGVGRNVKDILGFDGVIATPGGIAVVKRMLESFSSSIRLTVAEQREAYVRHEQAIKWAYSTYKCTQKGLRGSSLLAPIVRAYYSQDHDKLARFLEVLRTGQMDGQTEVSAILLRNYVMTLGVNRAMVGRKAREEVYAKTERAIAAFLKGEIIGTLRAATEELFPIADDTAKPKKVKTAQKVLKLAKMRKAG